jgi:peptidoglycan/xylan/chitin deacetylase (PgdA/CDA1 family)
MTDQIYRPDMTLKGKVRRRLTRLQHRWPATGRIDRPTVSFAFDDAPQSAITAGAAILERFGKRGTYFISAGLAGTEGHMGPYATPTQIVDASSAGHEIACHTYSHLDCGQADEAAVARDIARNSATLINWGVPKPRSFAYPFGDVSAAAKKAVSERFVFSRALHHGVINTGCDFNQAPAIAIEGETGEALARRWMDKARHEVGWVILFTHGVEAKPTNFGTSVEGFSRLVDEAVALDFDIVTIAEGARRMGGPS